MSNQIFTAYFLDDQQWLDTLLDQAQSLMAPTINDQGEPVHDGVTMDLAMISAFRGSVEDVKQFITMYLRYLDSDLAAKPGFWHYTCRILSVATATSEAIQCLREVLTGRSSALPYIEPYSPFYDPIRDDPAFTQMMVDIGEEP